MLEKCPAGYVNNGKSCSRTIALPMIQVCEYGTDNGKSCVTSESAPMQTNKHCPPGTSAEKGVCTRTETYDCTPPSSKKGLRQLGHKKHGGHKKSHYRPMNYGKKQPVYNKKRPVYTKKAPMPIMTKKRPVMPIMTKKRPVMPAKKPSYTSFGQRHYGRYLGHKHHSNSNRHYAARPVAYKQPVVQKKAPVVPHKKAPVIQHNKTCERKINEEYIVNSFCPTGYTQQGKNCTKTINHPKVSRCSDLSAGKACSKTETAPKDTYCPPGYSQQGKECVKTQHYPKIERCSVPSAGKNCEIVKMVEKEQYCTIGSGKNCTTTETCE